MMRNQEPTNLFSKIDPKVGFHSTEATVVNKAKCPVETADLLCRQLMQIHRDPSSIGLAEEITVAYRSMTKSQRAQFMALLNDNYDVDESAIIEAAQAYESDPGFKTRKHLSRVVEAPRQKLFRYINTAPDGLQTLILMRKDLLEIDLPIRIALAAVEEDFRYLLQSWFNHGFLVLKRIDWNSPACLLEKLIEYEAVHQISNWDDLRRRLQDDRRCYAFFHPAMQDEPLVFVEVALTNEIAGNINDLISPQSEVNDPLQADTAMFYSISSCHKGLMRISFGGWLIKQVVHEIQSNLPRIKTFSTLSPVPGFCRWLGQQNNDQWPQLQPLFERLGSLGDETQASKESMERAKLKPEILAPFRETLMSILANFLLNEKLKGRPIDSVARFHLSNGAQLRAIHWLGDPSENGMANSFGIMVNYVYEIKQIQTNRQNFLQHGIIAAHSVVHGLAKLANGVEDIE